MMSSTPEPFDRRAGPSDRDHPGGIAPPRERVLLFATPWMKAAWPSLAIGSLKSHLRANGVETRCLHLHLEAAASIGWAHYDALAETWGAGEALFGALLDPDDAERLVEVAAGVLRRAGHPDTAEWVEKRGCEDLRALVDTWLERERPERYAVVGGSIGAMQLCGTLYLMKRVRERGHAGTRILGGSALVGSVAHEVLTRCTDVDFVIAGEGEQALLSLVTLLRGDRPTALFPPGVLARDAKGAIVDGGRPAPMSLEESLPPDLDEFFEAARRLGVPKTGLTLSFEHSRGCEWEHRSPGRLRGCTFCGLYRNSPSFRRKSVERAVSEIEEAVRRHRVLNLAFVDAYIPREYRDELLDGLNALPADITFFTEMRCDLTESTGKRLAMRANRVQLGVESFSNRILRRLGKGVSSVSTAYSVRLCQDLGIPVQYNLILRIPGVTAEEIDELTGLLPTLFGLPPPASADFYLDRNSRIFAEPGAHGLSESDFDQRRPEWLARSIGDSRICQVVPLPPPSGEVEEAWRQLERQIQRWHECWRMTRGSRTNAPLTWRDGGGWASIVDAREPTARIYTIDGVLYDAFVACAEVRTLEELTRGRSEAQAEFLEAALEELITHRLVFREGRQLVSVATRVAARAAGIRPQDAARGAGIATSDS